MSGGGWPSPTSSCAGDLQDCGGTGTVAILGQGIIEGRSKESAHESWEKFKADQHRSSPPDKEGPSWWRRRAKMETLEKSRT
jgi:hypothetical protein